MRASFVSGPVFLEEAHHRLGQRLRPVAGGARDQEMRALEAQSPDDIGRARLCFLRRQQVRLVQHQPARLVGQVPCCTSSAPRRWRAHPAPGRPRDQAARCRSGAAARACAAGASGSGCPGPRLRPRLRSARECRPSRSCGAGPRRPRPRFGIQRGERIVRHARPRRRHRADQRRLAGVGQAQQAHVGDHLHLELAACASRRAGPGRTGAARDWCST